MKKIKDEGIIDLLKFTKPSGYNKEKLKSAISAALKKVDYAIETLGDKFASHSSINNVYQPVLNDSGWNSGFWTGILWLSYELSGDEKYKKLAMQHIPTYTKRMIERLGIDHHDMGFVCIPSCIAAYKITGDKEAKKTALMAADNLMLRYHEKGQFIQAWGKIDDLEAHRLIVDCLLNIPLLYWASSVTDDPKYADAAYKHYRTTIENAIREDSSTFHTFYFDPETGAPIKGVTAQGASDDSCWARGQAWAIYGMMLTRIYIDDPDAVPLCKKLTNFYLNRLPKDYVPFWDMSFTDGDDEPRDSSSASIAVCGILELIKYLPDNDSNKEVYKNTVNLMMESLYDNYSTKDTPESNGLLLHAVYSKPGNNGVDECNIWGCYFYMEALARLSKNWKLYW